MPDIEIKNETEHVLRMSLAFGVQLFCENVGAQRQCLQSPCSISVQFELCSYFADHESDAPALKLPYIFEVCFFEDDNINDGKAGIAAIAVAVVSSDCPPVKVVCVF